MITVIRNNYRRGVFFNTEVLGTFASDEEARDYLADKVFCLVVYEQIAPCGYERKNAAGERAEHIIIANSPVRERDVNNRWVVAK